MKLAALALLCLAACSVSAATPGDPRVRYTVSFAAGSDDAALQKVVEVYKLRLDKLASDASFRTDAKASTIAVELPVSVAFPEEKRTRTLVTECTKEARTLSVPSDDEHSWYGLVKVDDEWMRLGFSECERGLFGSQVVAHAPGAKLHLFRDDFVHAQLRSQGTLEFLLAVTSEFLTEHETTLGGEPQRFEAWRKSHPDARLAEFDDVARNAGGPLPGTVWRRLRNSDEHKLLLRPAEPRFRFGHRDLASTGFSQDAYGYPAVSFDLTKERAKDFGDWTASILHRGMAVVLDDEILTLATVNSKLPGGGIIEGGSGGFSKEEVQALVALLRLPLLPLPPLALKLEFLP